MDSLPTNLSSTFRLSADDCAGFRHLTSTSDHDSLQADLKLTEFWCSIWLMSLNPDKCHHLHIGKDSTSSYTLCNTSDPVTDNLNYVGVTSAPRSQFHVSYIVKTSTVP